LYLHGLDLAVKPPQKGKQAVERGQLGVDAGRRVALSEKVIFVTQYGLLRDALAVQISRKRFRVFEIFLRGVFAFFFRQKVCMKVLQGLWIQCAHFHHSYLRLYYGKKKITPQDGPMM